jgi:WD40 repeat protein
LRGHTGGVNALTFFDDGRFIASAPWSPADGDLRLWPLDPDGADIGRVVWGKEAGAGFTQIAVDPAGKKALLSEAYSLGEVFLVPLEEEALRVTNIWPQETSRAWAVTFSSDGKLAAAGAAYTDRDEDMVIRIWNLESGVEQVLPLRDSHGAPYESPWDRGVFGLRFTPDGELLSSGLGGIRHWDLDTGKSTWIYSLPKTMYARWDASRDARFLLTGEIQKVGENEASNLQLHDCELGTVRAITTHGPVVNHLAIDSTGTIIATRGPDGMIRAGSADGSEPHLLFGHEGPVKDLAISPDGHWIASGGEDGIIRLWPMPDVSQAPLHTLPQNELIAKLKTLTNLRAVRDEGSPTGWKIEVGPFPGWETVPTW